MGCCLGKCSFRAAGVASVQESGYPDSALPIVQRQKLYGEPISREEYLKICVREEKRSPDPLPFCFGRGGLTEDEQIGLDRMIDMRSMFCKSCGNLKKKKTFSVDETECLSQLRRGQPPSEQMIACQRGEIRIQPPSYDPESTPRAMPAAKKTETYSGDYHEAKPCTPLPQWWNCLDYKTRARMLYVSGLLDHNGWTFLDGLAIPSVEKLQERLAGDRQKLGGNELLTYIVMKATLGEAPLFAFTIEQGWREAKKAGGAPTNFRADDEKFTKSFETPFSKWERELLLELQGDRELSPQCQKEHSENGVCCCTGTAQAQPESVGKQICLDCLCHGDGTKCVCRSKDGDQRAWRPREVQQHQSAQPQNRNDPQIELEGGTGDEAIVPPESFSGVPSYCLRGQNPAVLKKSDRPLGQCRFGANCRKKGDGCPFDHPCPVKGGAATKDGPEKSLRGRKS